MPVFHVVKCSRCGETGCVGCWFNGFVRKDDVFNTIGGFKNLHDLVDKLRDYLAYGYSGVVSDLFVFRYRGRRYVLFYVPSVSVKYVEDELRRCDFVRGFSVVDSHDGVSWFAVRLYGDEWLDHDLAYLLGVLARAWCVEGEGFKLVGGVLVYRLPSIVFLERRRSVNIVSDPLLSDTLWFVMNRARLNERGGIYIKPFYIPVVLDSYGPSVSGLVERVNNVLKKQYGLKHVKVYFDPSGLTFHVRINGKMCCSLDEDVLEGLLRNICDSNQKACEPVNSIYYDNLFHMMHERHGLGLVVPSPILVFLGRRDIDRIAEMIYGMVLAKMVCDVKYSDYIYGVKHGVKHVDVGKYMDIVSSIGSGLEFRNRSVDTAKENISGNTVVLGLYNYGYKIAPFITIMDNRSIVYLHELAHHIDEMLGVTKKYWDRDMYVEAWKLFNYIGIVPGDKKHKIDASELFAETYALYLLFPKTVKRVSPKLYSLFRRIDGGLPRSVRVKLRRMSLESIELFEKAYRVANNILRNKKDLPSEILAILTKPISRLTRQDKEMLIRYALMRYGKRFLRDVSRVANHHARYVYTWLKNPFRRDIPGVDTPDNKKYVVKLLNKHGKYMVI